MMRPPAARIQSSRATTRAFKQALVGPRDGGVQRARGEQRNSASAPTVQPVPNRTFGNCDALKWRAVRTRSVRVCVMSERARLPVSCIGELSASKPSVHKSIGRRCCRGAPAEMFAQFVMQLTKPGFGDYKRSSHLFPHSVRPASMSETERGRTRVVTMI